MILSRFWVKTFIFCHFWSNKVNFNLFSAIFSLFSRFRPFSCDLLQNPLYCLHLLQTHTTYDGTAIDVIITSGLSSVSMMIAFVFILEFHDRGLIFGWPQKHHEDALGWSQIFRKMTAQTSYIMRKYHGYCFVWFNIWTFWYHPLENTFAHATGIFLIWQFLLQSSLIYTDMHLVKPWRFFVEISVVIHGPAVALQMELYQPTPTGQPSLWPMFLYRGIPKTLFFFKRMEFQSLSDYFPDFIKFPCTASPFASYSPRYSHSTRSGP